MATTTKALTPRGVRLRSCKAVITDRIGVTTTPVKGIQPELSETGRLLQDSRKNVFTFHRSVIQTDLLHEGLPAWVGMQPAEVPRRLDEREAGIPLGETSLQPLERCIGLPPSRM